MTPLTKSGIDRELIFVLALVVSLMELGVDDVDDDDDDANNDNLLIFLFVVLVFELREVVNANADGNSADPR